MVPLVVVVAAAVVVVAVATASPTRHPRSAARSRPTTHGLSIRLPASALGPSPALVAHATVPWLAVYAHPGALFPEEQLANPTPLGADLVLLVDESQRQWLEVYLPQRPNESTGWVRRAEVTVTPDWEHIVVSLSRRTLTFLVDGVVDYRATVAVGSPDSPTPTGHFFVTERLALTDPQDAYGPYAFGLSGFSNTYYAFDGGPGQIAIHGTNQPWVIGGYASHGCVRLANAAIAELFPEVVDGTPVDIVP